MDGVILQHKILITRFISVLIRIIYERLKTFDKENFMIVCDFVFVSWAYNRIKRHVEWKTVLFFFELKLINTGQLCHPIKRKWLQQK